MLQRFILIAFCVLPATLSAQNARFTFVTQDEPLNIALQRLVNLTKLELAYDPDLVLSKRTFCFIREALPEQLLECILKETGLDFYRLSSGTYVLSRSAKAEITYGAFYGQVEDADSGSPLPFASVLLADAGVGVQTNRDGLFSIPKLLPGEYNLLITYVGYEAHRQKISVSTDAQQPERIVLRPTPTTLLPVIIEGIQGILPADQLTVNKTFEEVFKSIPVSQAGQIWETTATLQGVRKDAFTSGLHLQGGDSGDHQILLDDTPVYTPLPLAQVIGPFSPYALGRVTVQKAGFGVAGGSSLAGVVQYDHLLPLKDGGELTTHIEPLAAHVRYVYGKIDPNRSWTVMTAARTALSPLIQSKTITHLLQEWSASDPLVASSSLLSQAPPPVIPTFIPNFDALNIASITSAAKPMVYFSDLHTAFRLQWRGSNTVRASLYKGKQAISGNREAFVEHSEITSNTGVVSANRTLDAGESYGWDTLAAQLRFQSILSAKSLFSLQLKLSQYNLAHQYGAPVNALSNFSDTIKIGDANALNHFNMSVSDGNKVREKTAETVFEWFPEPKFRSSFRLGFTQNRSNLRYQNLPFRYNGSSNRWHGSMEQHFRFRQDFVIEGGLRGTFFMQKAAFFPEPRLAVYWQPQIGWGKKIVARVAIGQYRQFVSQFDLSTYSTNSFLPSLRVWIPVDSPAATVYMKQTEISDPTGASGLRIPGALHVASELLFETNHFWTFRIETYHKELSNVALPNWRVLSDLLHDRPILNSDQSFEFLSWGKGKATGAGILGDFKRQPWHLTLRYDWTKTRYLFPDRFNQTFQPTPWSSPHRTDARLVWQPQPTLTLLLRWQGEWGRSWGYRSIYYDDLSFLNPLLEKHGIDFQTPGQDRLPLFSQLDIGLAYLLTKPANLQFRFDILNVTNRKNIMDWKLIYNPLTNQYDKKSRYLIPFLPSFSIRITW
ncbi:MAG TPA: carboxypeptidase-like regulatory domain-containing protein [Rhodothermales bacterium]|nr:carboxypeptidase-like regulatory domain-containing protein [Rhodothermales bacterium]